MAMRTPFSSSQPMPMDTLGPILQSLPILAEGCTMTLPSYSGPLASWSGCERLKEARCSCKPAQACRVLCQAAPPLQCHLVCAAPLTWG